MCVSWRARAAENGAAGREMRGGKGERGIPRERERECHRERKTERIST